MPRKQSWRALFWVERYNEKGFRCQGTGGRDPQNTEQGIMNVEGFESFFNRHSLFDIQNGKACLKTENRHQRFTDTRNLTPEPPSAEL